MMRGELVLEWEPRELPSLLFHSLIMKHSGSRMRRTRKLWARWRFCFSNFSFRCNFHPRCVLTSKVLRAEQYQKDAALLSRIIVSLHKCLSNRILYLVKSTSTFLSPEHVLTLEEITNPR